MKLGRFLDPFALLMIAATLTCSKTGQSTAARVDYAVSVGAMSKWSCTIVPQSSDELVRDNNGWIFCVDDLSEFGFAGASAHAPLFSYMPITLCGGYKRQLTTVLDHWRSLNL